MKFITKKALHSTLRIGYKLKYIEETNNSKFLTSEIDNHIQWKERIEQGISKLCGAGYAVRLVVHVSNVHSKINSLCILPFCYKIWNNFGGGGNSSYRVKNFTSQKKMIRIMAVAQPITPCRSLFNHSRFSA